MKLALSFCPPCDSSSHPPFHPNSLPLVWNWLLCSSFAKWHLLYFFFFFCCGSVFYLSIAFSHVSFLPPLPSEFYFFCPEKPDPIPKKDETENSNLKKKKNLKKKQKKILNDSFSFINISIVSYDLCLVLCSIDDEHLIMVFLYIQIKKKKTKKRSEFNSVYNKNFKMTLLA